MPSSFKIIQKDRTTQARLGILRTPHGIVKTPTYVIVATKGAIRTLTPADVKTSKTQMVISNTYHLWDEKNVHRKFGVRMPMMTDSGGFQVFSFGAAKEHGVGKVLAQPVKHDEHRVNNVRITEKGVHFKVDGKKRFLSPEISMAIQKRLGADIIFAFDECTSPLHPFAYQKQSMHRTHRWAERSLKAHDPKQLLYGIVQGGRFKSLRTASAKAIGKMPFDGFGIGGSFGEEGMAQSLSWIAPHLPEDKPRHLLGIGTVKDIFIAVDAGMDTFDCVIPTREARHGKIYTDTGAIDIRKLSNAKRFPRMHTLFRAKDPRAGRLATLHNVRWFNLLLTTIRTALADGSYPTFKRNFLKTFSSGAGK